MRKCFKSILISALVLFILTTFVSCFVEDARFTHGDDSFLLSRDGTGRYVDPSGKKYKLEWDKDKIVIDKVTRLNIYRNLTDIGRVFYFSSEDEVIRSNLIVVQVEPLKFYFYYKK